MDDVTGTAAEDRVKLILASEREAPVPTGLVAREPVPVVPAPRSLAQVAGQRPDVADLRLEINPSFNLAYYNRGIAYSEKGKYDQATSDLTKALEITPRFALAYYNRGVAYMKKGKYDQAISDLTKALEINPRFANAYDKRGFAYFKKGQYDQAISDLTKALEINPRSAKAYITRGTAYAGKGRYDKAWEDVHKAKDLGYKIPPRFLKALRKVSGRQK